MARIHYEIPDDLHRKAKAWAATDGITLKDFIIRALDEAVRRQSAADGPAKRATPKPQ